jgi:hypothetical protein
MAPDRRLLDIITRHGVKFASLEWLRRMKRAAGRPKDLLDLENLADLL